MKKLFDVKNDKDETPLDINKDIRILSLLYNDLKHQTKNFENKLMLVKNELILTNNRLGELQSYMSSHNILLNSIVWCMFIFFGYYFIKG